MVDDHDLGSEGRRDRGLTECVVRAYEPRRRRIRDVEDAEPEEVGADVRTRAGDPEPPDLVGELVRSQALRCGWIRDLVDREGLA